MYTDISHHTEISDLLVLRVDMRDVHTRSLGDRLLQQSLADAELQPFVIWADPVDAQVNDFQQVVGGALNDGAEELGQVGSDLEPLCSGVDTLECLG